MRKFLRSIPPFKFIVKTVLVSMLIGVIAAEGVHPKALFGLVFAFAFIVLVTLKNMDPVSWEQIHEPRLHSMRLQRDAVANQLRAVLDTHESGDQDAIRKVNLESRELLADLQPTRSAQ